MTRAYSWDRERLAEIICTAFGPAFIETMQESGRTKPDGEPWRATAYHDLPEGSKQLFRTIADEVFERLPEWLR